MSFHNGVTAYQVHWPYDEAVHELSRSYIQMAVSDYAACWWLIIFHVWENNEWYCKNFLCEI